MVKINEFFDDSLFLLPNATFHPPRGCVENSFAKNLAPMRVSPPITRAPARSGASDVSGAPRCTNYPATTNLPLRQGDLPLI